MRVALYARVSTGKQEAEQTIESQLLELRTYVEAKGYSYDEKHVFLDEGYTGTRLDRPSLDALRDAVAMGEVHQVIICSPERFTK